MICKIATREEIIERWNELIEDHPWDDSWKGYKERTLEYFDNKTMIQYFGIEDGKIICECCAHIDKDCTYDEYLPEHEGDDTIKVYVNYYYKEI